MPRPARPAPARPLLSAAAALLCALAAGAPLHARLQFAERQVLPADRVIDLLAWLPEGDPGLAPPFAGPEDSAAYPAPALPWGCGAEGFPFRLSSCHIARPGHGGGGRSGYLYWAFLNLDARSRRGDLAALETDHQAWFDALPRPLLALRKRGDSCAYLVAYRESYAPSAAGRVACPDLGTALAAVDADLRGRAYLPSRGHVDRDHKTVSRPGQFLPGLPQVLDVGAEASAAIPIAFDTEETSGEGPYAATREHFDLGDLTDPRIPPLSLRPYLLFRGLVGVRLGYEFAGFSLAEGIFEGLKSEAASQGFRLESWRIQRHTFSAELLLGRTFRSGDMELYTGAFLGLAGTDYRETVEMDGREEVVDGILADVPALLLGGSAQLRIGEAFLLGVEMGFAFRQFEVNQGASPDGSGSEVQLRLILGGFHRHRFGLEPEH